jgi:hypothetical protein
MLLFHQIRKQVSKLILIALMVVNFIKILSKKHDKCRFFEIKLPIAHKSHIYLYLDKTVVLYSASTT